QTVPVGAYDLSETAKQGVDASGYDQVGLACYMTGDESQTVDLAGDDNNVVTLADGDDVTCEFTNTDSPAHLTLVKDVSSTHGGSADPTDWTLTATLAGADDAALSGTSGVAGDLDAGTYVLAEEA